MRLLHISHLIHSFSHEQQYDELLVNDHRSVHCHQNVREDYYLERFLHAIIYFHRLEEIQLEKFQFPFEKLYHRVLLSVFENLQK